MLSVSSYGSIDSSAHCYIIQSDFANLIPLYDS